ncbi:MAG: cardiolipin synthase [Ketobacter sp.]
MFIESAGALSSFLSTALVVLHFCFIVGFSVRVILKRSSVGVSLSWLLLLTLLPYVGVVLYLLFGERYLGIRYRQRMALLLDSSHRLRLGGRELHFDDWEGHHPMCRSLSNYEMNSSGIPALGGNAIELLESASLTIRSIVKDIDQAQLYCHLEFYIWQAGGLTQGVLDALIRAHQRGVVCRVMLDAVGSQLFFKTGYYEKLVQNGIKVIKACPIGIPPWRLARYDLRNHRKSIIIDGRVAYTGSFNLIDPASFKQDHGVGQWIDVMARMEGPAVNLVDAVFRWYWNIETSDELEIFPRAIHPASDKAIIQVVPSGPDADSESILSALLQAIYSASTSIKIVTPYFVPDISLVQALKIAAKRGVQVDVILPRKVDSFLVRYASRSYFQELLDVGIHIHLYDNGLLHSKCVVVDSEVGFFGTVNMDSRSLWLNFEMTLIVYSRTEAADLVDMIQRYQKDTEILQKDKWKSRPTRYRFFENLIHLFSPLI